MIMDDEAEQEGAIMATVRRREDAALDLWLRASLKARYAETLREPVPDALLDLLRGDDKA